MAMSKREDKAMKVSLYAAYYGTHVPEPEVVLLKIPAPDVVLLKVLNKGKYEITSVYASINALCGVDDITIFSL